MQPKWKINRICWITHPSWVLTNTPSLKARGTWTMRDVENFINTSIIPAIKQAQAEPNTLVVFVKSPKFKANDKANPANRQMGTIEAMLEAFVKRVMKQRSIICQDDYAGREKIALEIISEIERKKFQISENASIVAFGVWRDRCATDFPKEFINLSGKRIKLSVRESGSIPITQAHAPPKKYAKKVQKKHAGKRRI